MIRLRCGLTGEITCMEITPSFVNFKKDITIENTVRLKTNTIDTNDDNDLVFKRNDVQFFALDKFTEDTIEKEAIICSKQLRANGQLLVNNLQINQFSVGVEYTDFRLENVDSVMRFYVGNGTNANLTITNAGITLGRVATCNGGIKSNIINTNGSNDMVFQIDGTEILKFRASDSLILGSDASTFSTTKVYTNEILNRTFSYDTVFYGANATSDGRVEYMKWNRSAQQLDFNAPIDNTGIAITGNIIDTTVSDERLKTNIKDVDTDFTSCIKNVKVKTFKYKDDKYKTNDTYGFIAQELKEHLPKECKNIVKENKAKNEDETFLSINYMKLSVVLWKCCQETLTKVEHLESSVYELQEELKEYKKPKAKSKAKAKSNGKA